MQRSSLLSIILSIENTLKDIEALLPTYKVSEEQLLLLRAFERRTQFPGQALNIVPQLDYSLAWASGEEEFRYLLRSLAERDLVSRKMGLSSLTIPLLIRFASQPGAGHFWRNTTTLLSSAIKRS